jgi:hypothetical protein
VSAAVYQGSPETPSAYYRRRWASLKNERNPWDARWREIDDHVSPMRARFLLSDRTKAKSNGKIINGTPPWAVDVAAAGMMGGITSPSRPWIRTAPANAQIRNEGAVREWSHDVDEVLLDIFARSNVYDGLPEMYADLLTFGTAAMFVDEDAEKVIRAYHLPIGQFALQNSPRLQVDTVYREMSLTVTHMVDRWGRDALSVGAKAAFDNRQFDTVFPVLHVVEPNAAYLPGALGPIGKRFKSAWLEQTGDDSTGLLGVGGYDEFPVLCPRWRVVGEDVYGVSPGMRALGDCIALQDYEKDKAAYVDRTVAPPMIVPASLANKRVTLLPGDKIVVPNAEANLTVRPAIDLKPDGMNNVELIIREHEARIRQAFFADLWLMFTGDERVGTTATEISARQQEKLLQLGPVMERLQNELLDPLIARVYAIAWRRGLIPEPPDALKVKNGAGQWVATQAVRVEYISVATQAQKAIGIIALERALDVAIRAAANSGRQDLLDNYDFDKWAKHHVEATGVPPDLLVNEDQVAAIRAERAKREQAQAQSQQAQQAADTASTLGNTPVQSDNALGALLASTNTPNSLGVA